MAGGIRGKGGVDGQQGATCTCGYGIAKNEGVIFSKPLTLRDGGAVEVGISTAAFSQTVSRGLPVLTRSHLPAQKIFKLQSYGQQCYRAVRQMGDRRVELPFECAHGYPAFASGTESSLIAFGRVVFPCVSHLQIHHLTSRSAIWLHDPPSNLLLRVTSSWALHHWTCASA